MWFLPLCASARQGTKPPLTGLLALAYYLRLWPRQPSASSSYHSLASGVFERPTDQLRHPIGITASHWESLGGMWPPRPLLCRLASAARRCEAQQ
jgi:hypothetical protein